MKSFLFLFIISTTLLVSCEKNTRDFLFGTTTTDKLTKKWKITSATFEGNDVTFNYDNYLLTFSQEGVVDLIADFKPNLSFSKYKTSGKWFFLNDQKKLLLDFENNEADVVYQILKLKDDEIWLKKEGEPLELHFISQ